MNDPFQFENDLTQKSVKLTSEENFTSKSTHQNSGKRGPHFRIDEPIVEQSVQVDPQILADQEKGLLKQATQIADHLRTQFDEIARRESNMNKQLSMLDKERRSVRMWVSQIETEFTERDGLLKQRETDLNEKLKSCNTLIQKIEQGDLASANRESQKTISSPEHVNLPDLEQFTKLEKENLRLRQQLHQLDEAHHADLEELRDDLVKEQDAIFGEYEQLKQKHQEEKQTWMDEHGDLDQERELYTEAIKRSQLELDDLLLSQTNQLKDQQGLLQLATEEFTTERENLSRQLEGSLQERNRLEQTVSDQEEKLKDAVEALDQVQQPVDHVTLDEFEEQKIQFQKQEAVLENRMRFQSDHLDKAREELQQMKNDLRQEKQKAALYFEEKNSILQKRKSQLIRFRNAIDARENSLKSSQSSIHDDCQTMKHDLVLEKQQIEKQKALWNQKRDMEQLECSSLRETISVKNELLEKQKYRLDMLKTELDQTGREQLETKCILERIQAEFLENVSSDEYAGRFASAQTELQSSLQNVKEDLDHQQVEMQNSLKEINENKQSLDLERQQLKQWFEKQKEILNDWEENLVNKTDKVIYDNSDLKLKSQKWSEEKLEAGNIIRGLLKQLEEVELEGLDQYHDSCNRNAA